MTGESPAANIKIGEKGNKNKIALLGVRRARQIAGHPTDLVLVGCLFEYLSTISPLIAKHKVHSVLQNVGILIPSHGGFPRQLPV